jgi:hypothetical protein
VTVCARTPLVLILQDFSHFADVLYQFVTFDCYNKQSLLPYTALAEGAFIVNALVSLGGRNFNPLNAELNPIYHLLALLGAHRILHVSRIMVDNCIHVKINYIYIY